ncbi:MAG: M16 family metallopeptidase [Aestuariivirgaceae bacterium]
MLRRVLSVHLLAAMLWLALGIAAHAFEIREVTSPGGIKAWLVEEHAIPLIAMSYSFRAGAASEPADRIGLTYFLAGMLDEGAGDLDSEAFRKRRDELSARLSFQSTADHFSGSFQALTENRDQSFDLLKLALTSPRFDSEPLERVRNQILLGLQDEKQDPEQIAFDDWRERIFTGHPYAHNPHGTEQDIRATTAADLRQRAAELFSRDKLLISVVGDIDAETLGRLLDQTFGSLPAKSKPLEIPDAVPAKGPSLTVVDRNIPQSIIQFGQSGILRSDPDFIAAYIMNDILGGSGIGSRLNDEIREKRGLSYSVYTDLYPLYHGAAMYGGAATRNDRAAETISLIKSELKRFATEGPTADELKDDQTYLTGSYALRFDTSTKIADQLLGIQEQDLGIDYVDKRNSLIEAVTLEDIKRIARRLIDADALIITVVGKPEGLKQ